VESFDTHTHVFCELQRFAADEAHRIPFPGSGDTAYRFASLVAAGRGDLSVARLVEGHLDALAILDEAGVVPADGDDTYGVWAARSSENPTQAERRGGDWVVTGTKPFCSGASFLDRALITAATPDGYRLFDIDLRRHHRMVESGSWQAVGMAGSDSQTFLFDDVCVPAEQAVGEPGFYLERPGFWFGASGVSACWVGGAMGLVETLLQAVDLSTSEHSIAAIARAHSRVTSMQTLLDGEASQIDLDPTDAKGEAKIRALILRQVTHDLCLDVLSLTAEAGGARLLCHDGRQSRRSADLFVYLAQHHGNRDALELAHLLLREPGAVHR
jgi:alkylation response protein AidB-like acyl-CoA dehydrogenase